MHRKVHQALITARKTLALAESCTGGAIAASLVEIPDASLFLLGSLVVYSNEWKEKFLLVRKATLQTKGAVSREVVTEMVQGLFSQTTADFALAVSGELGVIGSRAFVGVGKRGEKIAVEEIAPPAERLAGIHFTVQAALTSLFHLLPCVRT